MNSITQTLPGNFSDVETGNRSGDTARGSFKQRAVTVLSNVKSYLASIFNYVKENPEVIFIAGAGICTGTLMSVGMVPTAGAAAPISFTIVKVIAVTSAAASGSIIASVPFVLNAITGPGNLP